tara:strand:+ start:1113 stop:2357 length:1245 start_codon:yes stop_codon:yes gene_type:complete
MAWGKQLSESPDTVTDDFKVTRTTNTDFNVILAHSIRSGGSNFTADWELNEDSGTDKHANRYSINGATDSTGTTGAYVTTSSSMPDDIFQVGYIFNNGTDEMLIIGWGTYQGTYNTSGIGAGTAPNRIEFVGKFVTAGNLTDFALNQNSSGDIATTTNVSWLGSDMTPSAAIPFAENVQVGSRAEITDTRKIYHFEEGQDTEENIFNSAFTMTGNAAQTTATDPTGKIVLTQSGGSGNQANAYRTLSSISSSNKTFTADFTFKRNTGDLANSNYVRFASVNTFTSGITGNAKRFYFSFENAGYIRVATETASDTSNTFTDGTDMQAANTTKYYRFVGNGSTLVLTMYPTLSDRTNGTNADRTYQSVNFPSDWTTTDPIDTFELLGASGYHTGNWEVSDVEMSFNSANAWKEEGT